MSSPAPINDLIETARACQNEGNWSLALEYWDSIVANAPDCGVHIRVARIRTLLELSRFDAAEAAAQDLIAMHPDDPAGYERLARIAQRRQQWPAALAHWDELLRRFPASPAGYYADRIHPLLELSRFDAAEAAAQDLIAMHPDDPAGYERLARIAQRRQQWPAALAHWDELLRRFPASPVGYYADRIHPLLELSRFEEAEAAAQALVAAHPDEPGGYERLARIAQRRQQWPVALACWDDLLQRFPASPVQYYADRIQALLELSRFDAAEAAAQALVAAHPDDPAGYERLARTAQLRLHREAALARWQAMQRRFPHNLIAFVETINALLSLMRFAEAMSQFQELTEKFQACGEVLLQTQQALFWERFQAFDRALPHWQAVLSENSTAVDARLGVARCLAKTGETALAETQLKQLCQEYPWHLGAMNHLVNLYIENNHKDLALKTANIFYFDLPGNTHSILLKLHCHLLVCDITGASDCLHILRSLQINSETLMLLDLAIQLKSNWLRMNTGLAVADSSFIDANRYFMTLVALRENARAEALLPALKAKFGMAEWFDHHMARLLLHTGQARQAFDMWQHIAAAGKADRAQLLGMMEAAWQLQDYIEVYRICMEFLHAFPANAAVKMYFEKTCLLLNTPIQYPLPVVYEKPHAGLTSFLHSGETGDLIYAMPIFKKLAPVRLFITTTGDTTQAMDTRIDAIKTLLLSQAYVIDVQPWQGEKVDLDMSGFRANKNLQTSNLTASQADYILGDAEIDFDTPWLSLPAAARHGRIVFARSSRYRNVNWDELWPVFKNMYPNALFVGLKEEYSDFAAGEYIATGNLMEAAEVIAGAALFIGNQSTPYAIAEGLKVNRILEGCNIAPNCCFKHAAHLF